MSAVQSLRKTISSQIAKKGIEDIADRPAEASPPGILSRMRADIHDVFERDPAARSTLEVLFCYPGVHAVWGHHISHDLWIGGHKFLRPPLLPAHAPLDRDRDPPGGDHRPRSIHRSRHGGCHWGDRRNRVECNLVPRGNPGRHQPEQRETPSNARG